MAFDRTTPEDAAALAEGRARMRALAGRICDAVEAMPLPETFGEGERAARTLTFADRLLERLPGGRRAADGSIPPARQRLRDFADTVLTVIEDLPMPETFRDGERALRCVAATERLYDQFYAPPKRTRLTMDEFGDEFEDEQDDSPEAADIRVFKTIDRMSLTYARERGFYPDGSVFERGAPEAPERLVCAEESRLMLEWINDKANHPYPPDVGMRKIAQIIIARFNAVARAQARHTGTWPGGEAFKEEDGDYYAVSKVYAASKRMEDWHRAPDEHEGPRGYPWWMIRAPDTG
jgi:hypothetical protein